jgi:hypothetical protein
MTQTNETLKATDIDGITGEVIERELTSEELSAREQMLAEETQSEAEAQAKVEARQSALAKLAAIGLTQEEIEAL